MGLWSNMFVIFYYYYLFRLLETFVGIVMFYEGFGCLLDELVCILLLKYDGILLEKKKQRFIKCKSPSLKIAGKINVWCSLHTLRALVMNSPKFNQILAKKCTLVILATHFSKTSNIKLSKYSLL